jgi:hypothetical protein
VEQEAIDGVAAYRPADFLADVRHGIWRELDSPQVKIDVYRRRLQNSYLDLLSQKLNGRLAVTDDYRSLIRQELRDLNAALGVAATRAQDRETRAHLADARDEIAKALDPRFAPPAQPTVTIGFPGFSDDAVFDVNALENFDPSACWPDYAVRIHPRKQ